MELLLPEVIETAVCPHVLAGAEAGDTVCRERDCRQTLALESLAVRLEIEVQVVEAVLLAMVGEIVHVGGNQVQKERCRRVGAGARLLSVDQRVVVDVDVKVGADCRFASYQRLVVRPGRRFEGLFELFGVRNQSDI